MNRLSLVERWLTRRRAPSPLRCLAASLLAISTIVSGPAKAVSQEPQVTDSATDQAHAPSGVIVVRPQHWSEALQAWKRYRTAQGYTVYELDADQGPNQVMASIAQMVATARERHSLDKDQPEIGFVVLVGDANLGQATEPLLPAWYRNSTAMVKFGGDKLLATDNPYADIDQDDKPDLAIGRIPADSPQDLSDYLQRVMRYERQLDFGLWRRDVRVVAGVGGFGALADSAIEMTTARFLTDRVPAWCDVSMTYASPNSPYCPDPFQFSQVTLQQLSAGSQFWVYIGHGHVKHLDFVHVEDQALHILQSEQIEQASNHQRPPIALFLACYTGAFDAREDCISEQMVMSPGGPVACVSATRVTGPYGLACLASRMLDECYIARQESLGQVMMQAKRNMLRPDPPLDSAEARSDAQMQLITGIASALSPAGHDLLQERREHVWQLNLLGDPLLRLHHPQSLELTAPMKVTPSDSVTISGEAGQAGTVTVELAWPRDRAPSDAFKAGQFSTDPDVREKMQASYAKANDRVIASQTLELTSAGPFTCQLIPDAPLKPGRYVVRVFVCGEKSCSAGSAELQVVRKR